MRKYLIVITLLLMSLATMSQLSIPGTGGIGLIEQPEPQNPVTWSAYFEVENETPTLVLTANIEEGWHLYSQNHKGTALPLVINLQPSECYKPLNDKFLEAPDPEEHYDEFFKETELYHSGTVTYKMPINVLTDTAFVVFATIDGQACIDGACVPVEANTEWTVLYDKGERRKEKGEIASPGGEVRRGPFSFFISHFSFKEILAYFFLAFLGGLLGILTPCVFPMIPMTVSYFMKHGGRKQALFYGISIVLIYVVVGIVLSAIFGQGFANDISTHWLPNVLFTLIFIVFAISLLGYFEITLPSSWVNGSAKNEERAGYIGTFFMALTLVLVSFSCTLPIAGAVALGAADGSWLKPIVGMLGFSLAFALPFTLFAFFPQWLDKLPKSGGWMGALKVTLAVVELAFALKFLSVADQAYDWGILNRELFIIIWVALFLVLGLYFIGVIHFPVDDYKGKPGKGRITMAVLSFAIVVYLIPGIWGSPLNAISGWLPPMKTQTLFLGSSNTDMHKNLEWQNTAVMDYDVALDSAKVTGKPVLLMFTGHGCVNCRKMEQLCLADDSVAARLQRDFIICTLYVDDKVSKAPSGEMLGDKNKRIQKELFQQNAQPCHYVLAPDGTVLSGPMFYETEPSSYINFLTLLAE